jgi:putative membrane protein
LALGGGILMTLMDILIEPVAPHLEYWMFEMNQVPWNNYAAWLWLGVLFSWILSFIPSKQTALGAWVFVLNWLFFVALNVWYL